MHALSLSTLTIFDETMVTFCLFHPLAKSTSPLFVNDFRPKIKVILAQEAFISILAHSPHLSSNGPLGMVYEFL
jgi:hypothetical protein